jgi:hypothetical protein
MGAKIRPSAVSIVAAGVCRPDGGLHPLPIEEVFPLHRRSFRAYSGAPLPRMAGRDAG